MSNTQLLIFIGRTFRPESVCQLLTSVSSWQRPPGQNVLLISINGCVLLKFCHQYQRKYDTLQHRDTVWCNLMWGDVIRHKVYREPVY